MVCNIEVAVAATTLFFSISKLSKETAFETLYIIVSYQVSEGSLQNLWILLCNYLEFLNLNVEISPSAYKSQKYVAYVMDQDVISSLTFLLVITHLKFSVFYFESTISNTPSLEVELNEGIGKV